MMDKLETIVTKELKVPEETLKVLNLVSKMSTTLFYEAAGVAIATALVTTAYTGYELVSACCK
jgi:hypothetical protein